MEIIITQFLLFAIAGMISLSSAGASSQPSPASVELFSSTFQQPKPPLVESSFRTAFIQHKWNTNLSHITSGTIYNSPSQGTVRVDQAYLGAIGSSIFNYANTSQAGVDNVLTTYMVDNHNLNASLSNPSVFRDYVNPDFPLFTNDFLIQAGAVFGGMVKRDLIGKKVSSWNIMYQRVIPVTVYVDLDTGMVVGYDYFSMDLRTRVVTEYFNTEVL